jgi:predicted enzyme related to lactoylglutathione lyase
MPRPVSHVELNSPDLPATTRFFRAVFDWEAQPFATSDYLVAPHEDAPGVDARMLASRDGNPRTGPVIRVDSIAALRPRLEDAGGVVVVEPFTLPGSGAGATSPTPRAYSSGCTGTTLRRSERPRRRRRRAAG